MKIFVFEDDDDDCLAHTSVSLSLSLSSQSLNQGLFSIFEDISDCELEEKVAWIWYLLEIRKYCCSVWEN
ncbi:hypothetical protein LWI28_002081 [Acer negundo]|uniref:Uncharacterized protein n=1 Tax=Acer negundo TaxID=4023 RepID=A0AAD5JI69_ACENE|nr:hypothetical protein LWI28_002081 [Acer negundo]